MKRTTLMLLTLVALFVAACSSNQADSSASQSAAAPAAQESDEATAAPAESEGESGSEAALPSFGLPDSAPELAALLPDEIAGQEALKLSMSGAELMSGEGGATVDPEFISFLERLGAQPDDISFAFSFVTLPEGDSAGIIAFRVAGASSDQLETEMRATMDSEGNELDWQPASVGGKDVISSEDPDNEGNTRYLYAVGDIVFIVTSPDEATAADLLEPLP